LAELLAPFAAERAYTAAQQLITHFGGLGRALAASPRQLSGVLDGDAQLAGSIAAARALVMAGLREQIARSPVKVGDPRLHDYLLLQLANASTERLHAIFVDSASDYIADKQIAEGTITHVSASLRTLLAHAFEAGAHGVILAHNHPSGSNEPSAADEAFTSKIGALLAAVDIRLHDHLIVGGGRVVSMRARGLL
jgi:DNA repair protein RadC